LNTPIKLCISKNNNNFRLELEKKLYENLVGDYKKNGYCIAKIYDEDDHNLIIDFTKKWVSDVLQNNANKDFNLINFKNLDLKTYHQWQKSYSYEHDGVFGAKNRYDDPPIFIKEKILNNKLKEILKALKVDGFNLWRDPGLEWLGYRIIRPDMNDGYPVSCKNWGAAAGVVSVWLPIIGFTELETIALFSGSHLNEYEKYLPKDSKFVTGEYRFAGDLKDLNFTRSNLNIGEAILYHPGSLHTEDVFDSKITRLNLEFRFRN